MRQETEVTLKLKEIRDSAKYDIKDGIQYTPIYTTITTECVRCGGTEEVEIKSAPDQVNCDVINHIGEYIGDGYLCESCKTGGSD